MVKQDYNDVMRMGNEPMCMYVCVCVCVFVCTHALLGMTSPAAAAFLYYLTDNWDHMSFLALLGCVKGLQE